MTRAIISAGIAVLVLGTLGCAEEEGAAERAGRALDDAAEHVRDAADEDGALEKAGEKMDEALEKAKEALTE